MALPTDKKMKHTRVQVMEMAYNVRDCAWPADVAEYMVLIEPMLRAYAELLPDERPMAAAEPPVDADTPLIQCRTPQNEAEAQCLLRLAISMMSQLNISLRKLTHPDPSADSGSAKDPPPGATPDIMVCELGDYAVPDARQWATVIMNDQKIAECYSNEGAQLVGAALRQYHQRAATLIRSDLVININKALQDVRAPDGCSYTRTEYFKAGARACIRAVDKAVRATTGARV